MRNDGELVGPEMKEGRAPAVQLCHVRGGETEAGEGEGFVQGESIDSVEGGQNIIKGALSDGWTSAFDLIPRGEAAVHGTCTRCNFRIFRAAV